MDGKRPDALSDAALDRELEAVLGVDPSPEFVARVRTRIANELPSPWRIRWTWAACAAVAAGLVMAAAIALWPSAQRMATPRQATAPSAPVHERAPTTTPTPRPADPSQPESMDGLPDSRRASAGRSSVARGDDAAPMASASARDEPVFERPPFPEVLISPDEVHAFEALVAAAQGRGVPPAASGGEERDALDLPSIELGPVIVEPVPQLASLQLGEVK